MPWVDNFGEELGKRNLTFLSPEKPADDTCEDMDVDCSDTLDDKADSDYFAHPEQHITRTQNNTPHTHTHIHTQAHTCTWKNVHLIHY